MIASKCYLRSECTDVKFINDILRKRDAAPGLILPIEVRTYHLRRAVHTVRLRFGRRIRQLFVSIEPIFIFCARFHGRLNFERKNIRRQGAHRQRFHRNRALARCHDTNFDLLGARRPNQETAFTGVHDRCAQGVSTVTLNRSQFLDQRMLYLCDS